MDRVLQFNFGYLPPKEGLTSSLPLATLSSKRQSPSRASSRNSVDINLNKKPRHAIDVNSLEWRQINFVRVLSADMVQQANSGHPGAAMGCAPIAHLLWQKVMQYNPKDPSWVNRDRFVLSNGHACALQYSMLHLTGYDLSLADLKAFRQVDSKTPGHPEVGVTAGVEVATGPLGQGLSNGVGLALAGAHMAATFNREGFTILDSFVYVICGDGCMQEGITSEACSLAGHLGLGRLIVLYDDNKIQIDGGTDLAFTEDVSKRYEAYGWQTLHVEDGDSDLLSLEQAIADAKADLSRPTLIKVTTTIGYGSAKAGTAGVHGAPLGHADLAAVKKQYGFTEDTFFDVPADVAAAYQQAGQAAAAKQQAWSTLMEGYRAAHPELAAELERRESGRLPEGWRDSLPRWKPEDKARLHLPTMPLDCPTIARPRPLHALLLTFHSPLHPARASGARHAPVVAARAQRALHGRARSRRRLRRPDALQSHQIPRRARLPGSDARGALHPLRRARARDGRHLQRHLRMVEGAHPLLRHLSQLHRVRRRRRAAARRRLAAATPLPLPPPVAAASPPRRRPSRRIPRCRPPPRPLLCCRLSPWPLHSSPAAHRRSLLRCRLSPRPLHPSPAAHRRSPPLTAAHRCSPPLTAAHRRSPPPSAGTPSARCASPHCRTTAPSTSRRTTRSAWVRTGRHTSPSRRCSTSAPCPTRSRCAPPTPTRSPARTWSRSSSAAPRRSSRSRGKAALTSRARRSRPCARVRTCCRSPPLARRRRSCCAAQAPR